LQEKIFGKSIRKVYGFLKFNTDKAKRFVRRGRKATDLENEMAELPKKITSCARLFCFFVEIISIILSVTSEASNNKFVGKYCRRKAKILKG
jgi:hypothetical protein